MPRPAPARPRTLLFLCDGSRVLLGRKKRGFGRGRIVGIGGGAEAGETIEAAAVREMIEETSVTPLRPRHVARLAFLFAAPTVRDMRVEVFTARDWRGEPSESDEVAPAWFERGELPWSEMWDDARLWLPKVLAGERFSAWFELGGDERVVRHGFEGWDDPPASV